MKGTLILLAAYAAALAAGAAQPLSEEQAALYAVSGGLGGGGIASIFGTAALTRRTVAAKVLSSGAVAPLLVMLALSAQAAEGQPVVYTFMPVVSYSLVAGLFGWLLVSLTTAVLNGISADDVRGFALKVARKCAPGLFPGGSQDGDR